MYNTDDIVNGISTRECFHALLESALEYNAMGQGYMAQRDLDILRACIGIDFNHFSNDNADYYHRLIDNAFNEFDYMVLDGYFSIQYYNYLLAICHSLIKINKAYSNNDLDRTLELVQKRLVEVEDKLAFLRKRKV